MIRISVSGVIRKGRSVRLCVIYSLRASICAIYKSHRSPGLVDPSRQMVPWVDNVNFTLVALIVQHDIDYMT